MSQRSEGRVTKTGGREATKGVIPGRFALSVGNPDTPVPDGWSWTPLGTLARLETGHTPSRKHPEFWGGEIPWIGIKDVTPNYGRTLTETQEYATQLGIDNSSARVLPAGTVCLSRTASVGYVVVMGVPMATSQDFVNWVCSPELNHRYLKYVLMAERSSYLRFASGTTHQTIYLPEVKAFHILRPPIEVQRKIAAVLAACDELIDNNLRRIQILEEMAQAVYREWFVIFRFPGHEDIALVDSPLGPIPEGWSESTVGEAATNFDRLRKPLSKMQRAEMQGEYPYYGAAKVFDYVDDYIFDGEYLLVAEDGSVVTPEGYPVLQLACGKFWANNHTHILQGSLVSTHHLYLALSRVQIMGYVTGAAQPKITQGALNRVPLVVPPQLIRVGFDELIKPMFDLRQNLLEQNANLRATRDLLLPKLVSGEIDVSEMEIDTEWLAS